MQDKFETFNSGILELCQVRENKIIRTVQAGIRFGDKTIGVNRYWQAQVSSAKVDRLVAVQIIPDIEYDQIVLINGVQYKLLQIQFRQDTKPSTLLLSLERLVVLRKDERDVRN